MKLDRVTFTGADDSIEPHKLIELSEKYPWIEWGILFIAQSNHKWATCGRFPSPEWVANLLTITKDKPNMNFCAHLCGQWVRDIMIDHANIFGMLSISKRFARVQLNFHGEPQTFDASIGLANAKRQFIFQVDGRNDKLIRRWVEKGLGFPLFDVSGGAGILPEDGWPKHWGDYCGYAGGLGPATISTQLPLIAEAAGDGRIWIDMETRVRSNDDALFDLAKVEAVCEAVKSFVTV